MTTPPGSAHYAEVVSADNEAVDNVAAGRAGASLVMIVVCAGIGAVLSPLAGWLWVLWSNPTEAPLASDGGLYLGEQELNRQSGVTLWFLVLGCAFGLVAGIAVGWLARRYGWVTVIGVLVLCGVGTVLSRYLGTHVFGADPDSEAAGASPGTLIRLGVSLDTWVAYLGWPVGGAAGVLIAISCWPHDTAPTIVADVEQEPPPGSDPADQDVESRTAQA